MKRNLDPVLGRKECTPPLFEKLPARPVVNILRCHEEFLVVERLKPMHQHRTINLFQNI
jgi:hypothetical protein